jgi:hypothetical protein
MTLSLTVSMNAGHTPSPPSSTIQVRSVSGAPLPVMVWSRQAGTGQFAERSQQAVARHCEGPSQSLPGPHDQRDTHAAESS